MFHHLKEASAEMEQETRHRPGWISEDTWTLIDQRSALRRTPGYSQATLQCLNCQVNVSLREDWKRRVTKAGDATEAALASKDHKGAWSKVKSWCKRASDRPPKPSWEELSEVTDECANLHMRSAPPGEPIPMMVDSFDVSDEVPDEDEMSVSLRLR